MQVRTSSGALVEVDAGRIEEIVAQLRRAGHGEEDLDEAVQERFDAFASARYSNDDAALSLSDDAAFDLLHGDAEADAARVNNGGASAQIAFLLAELGEGPLQELIDSLGG